MERSSGVYLYVFVFAFSLSRSPYLFLVTVGSQPWPKGNYRLAFVTALGEDVVPVLRGANVKAGDRILFKGSDVLL